MSCLVAHPACGKRGRRLRVAVPPPRSPRIFNSGLIFSLRRVLSVENAWVRGRVKRDLSSVGTYGKTQIALRNPSITSAPFVRVAVLAGSFADVPCQAPELPWSMIARRRACVSPCMSHSILHSIHSCASVNARCASGLAHHMLESTRT